MKTLFIIATLSFAAVSIWCGIRNLRRFIRFRAFPTASAMVTSENVMLSASADATCYWPQAEYIYVVDGITYSSNLLWSLGNFGGFGYSRRKARKILAVFQNKEFSVFYNPTNPRFAFAFNGPLPPIYIPIIVGLLMLVYSVYVIKTNAYRPMHLTTMPSALLSQILRTQDLRQKQVVAGDRGRQKEP